MAKKDERFLNVTLKNEDGNERDEIIISFSAFIKQLKRFLIFWLVVAILVGILIPVYFAVFTADQHKNLKALVSFNYSGIEKGLAPDGSKFDVNSLKNPAIIEKALTEQGLSLDHLEGIRRGISIEGVVPTNAIDRITVYKSPYEQGSITAAERILDTSYYPTLFEVTFNYSAAGLTGSEPVEVFNSMLNYYNDYFFETYGFNEALGSAVTALDYKAYDYPEQVDVFNSSLSSLQTYISNLSSNDTTRFRSTTTGYTFADLSQAIQTVRDVDLALLSANILQNNITKDKTYLMDYYTRRIEMLTQDCAVAEGQIKALDESIASYQVGSVIVYDNGDSGTTYNTPSSAYDDLFSQKVSLQRTLSSKQETLKDIQRRLNMLKSQPAASQEQLDKVESDMAALSAKVNDLLNKTNATANEYYETVYLSNAYSVLVPASSSAMTTTKSVIKSAIEPLFIAEALIFVLYFGYAFVYSLIMENKKRKAANANTDADDKDESDSDAKDEDDSKDPSQKVA